ncbi:MAG: ArsA-related P-loop ATPase [Gemmatimonadota bacterium]
MTPLDSLLDLIPAARPVFVTGKGGVGKSTTAGALALALADHASPVRILSVDPAHSLADLFGVSLTGGEARAVCGAALVVEELDADARAAAWKAGDGAALADLVERGTYLRPDEVRGFLEPALPGVDEAMAALRLAELHDGAERLVVDTAPTGHTLRLLEAADLLEGWGRAFAAMAEKAAAVEAALVRHVSATPGGAALERLDAATARFRALLEEAVWVVVDRPGAVVAAETERLLARLTERGCTVVARVRVGGPAPERDGGPPVVVLDGGAPAAGCEGLRAWGAAAGGEPPPAAEAPPPRSAPAEDAPTWVDGLGLRLLLVTGKGGVGKSTCACAVALRLAASRSVLLLGTDPAGSLADVLARPVPPGGVAVAPGLRVREVDAPARFAALAEGWRDEVEDVLERVGGARGAALDRRVMDSLWELAPPGVDELAALAELLDEVAEGTTVVVDTAPTGHLLRLLAMPATALGWTRALLRILGGLGGAGALDTTVQATVDLARRLRKLQERLRDPAHSGALVVSTSGQLVEAETARLLAALEGAGIAVAAHIHNLAGCDGAVDRGQDRGATGPTAVHFRAPTEPRPPTGPEALAAFLSSWRQIS